MKSKFKNMNIKARCHGHQTYGLNFFPDFAGCAGGATGHLVIKLMQGNEGCTMHHSTRTKLRKIFVYFTRISPELKDSVADALPRSRKLPN
jgi:hypothetical protein